MKDRLWRAYYMQGANAKRRHIPFLLTFDEWLQIWKASGCLSKRGRMGNQYVMARFGDKGPYAVGNVKIILSRDNCDELVHTEEAKRKMSLARMGNQNLLGYCPSAETRAKISRANKGYRHTEEAKKKISQKALGHTRFLGRRHSDETRKKISQANKGKVFSASTRAKMGEAKRQYGVRRKEAEAILQ